ncbi:MAG: DNA-binding protein WhiA [Clostridiales bacterium]|nr:DNA-binding protein WhiA [Candidatus Equinaster intestinalis]
MSFSAELKTELCKLKVSECCRKAELSAMAVFGLDFSRKNISFLSGTAAVAQNFGYLLHKTLRLSVRSAGSDGIRPTYKVSLTENDAAVLKEYLENFVLSENECCLNSFLRGAFLACGQISDPDKSIRIDFRVKNKEYTDYLCNLLTNRGLDFYISRRDKYDLIYIKKSESVEDLITCMGAGNITLKIMEAKMVKELRNDTNRRANIEVFNLGKIVNSSVKQRTAIEKIIKKEKFETLPDDLKEVALLRMANQEASLEELCKLCSFSVTRSGLNHKLQRLIDLSKEI